MTLPVVDVGVETTVPSQAVNDTGTGSIDASHDGSNQGSAQGADGIDKGHAADGQTGGPAALNVPTPGSTTIPAPTILIKSEPSTTQSTHSLPPGTDLGLLPSSAIPHSITGGHNSSSSSSTSMMLGTKNNDDSAKRGRGEAADENKEGVGVAIGGIGRGKRTRRTTTRWTRRSFKG